MNDYVSQPNAVWIVQEQFCACKLPDINEDLNLILQPFEKSGLLANPFNLNLQCAIPGIPLLVWVESQALVQPVNAWLDQEFAARSGSQCGDKEVFAQPQGDQATRETALLAALRWLAEHSERQPCFQANDFIQGSSQSLALVQATYLTR